MPRALLGTLALLLGLAACPSSKPQNTIPSDMLGPSGASSGATAGAGADAAATPVEPAPGGDPAAAPPPAPLAAEEQALLGEMQAIMKDVTAQFEKLVAALEQAGGDCQKAAAALSTSASASLALEQKMTAFRQKLEAGPRPSAALMAQLREATLAAFPVDTRARADVTFDALDKKCANDAEFQRAKAAAAPQQ